MKRGRRQRGCSRVDDLSCGEVGGLPTEATVAQVLVSKYADHLSGA